MNTENFVVNDGSESEVVEDVRAVAPNVHRAELSQALIVEAIDLGDLAGLVVSSDECDSLRVAYLQGNQ